MRQIEDNVGADSFSAVSLQGLCLGVRTCETHGWHKKKETKHFKQYRKAKQKLTNKENLVRFVHWGKASSGGWRGKYKQGLMWRRTGDRLFSSRNDLLVYYLLVLSLSLLHACFPRLNFHCSLGSGLFGSVGAFPQQWLVIKPVTFLLPIKPTIASYYLRLRKW